MRILILTPTLPVPISGGRTRLFNLIRQLSANHQISVLTFVQPGETDMTRSLEPYCQQVYLVTFEGFQPTAKWKNRLRGWTRIIFSNRPLYVQVFPVSALRDKLRQILAGAAFDVVYFEQLFLVELLPEIGNLPVVLGEQNVESDIERKRFELADSPVHRLRNWLTWRKLLRFERSWLQRFPVCVAVSDQDSALLRELSPNTECFLVANGVDSVYFAQPAAARDRRTLLFFGSLSYGPNADGIVWFCNEVFPIVRAAVDDVSLKIVGLNPPPRVAQLGALPGVDVVGFVDDLRPLLWSATVAVVPLLIGGGTRLKILEALAAGCPVVSTSMGAEGLDLNDGVHLILADRPESFADAVVELLRSPDRCTQLGQAGQTAVREQYDWRPIALQLEAALARAVELHTNATAS